MGFGFSISGATLHYITLRYATLISRPHIIGLSVQYTLYITSIINKDEDKEKEAWWIG